MSKNSYAETTNDAKVMIAGLIANSDTVAKRGLDRDFIASMEKTLELVRILDNEQESLKAKLKTKTEELDKEIVNLQKLHSEAKKVVKISVPQSGWREFGIEDKQ